MNRYIHTFAIMLAALMAVGTAKAQEQSAGVHIHGSVYGGGNNADVQTNTAVNIGAGQVDGNVYGGGNVGDVGTINKTNIRAYKWTNDTNPGDTYNYNNTGSCTVTITGGTIGPDGETTPDDKGNVFGAGKGVAESFWCEKAMVYKTTVSITNGTVKGDVYGGGEIGRVETNTTVTIGTAGEKGEGSKPAIIGNVFGAGAGLKTHGYSALVRGNTGVTVQGVAKVGKSVYGGGEIATVGKYNLVQKGDMDTEEHRAAFFADHPGVDPLIEVGMPYSITSDNLGICTVTVKDNAVIGQSGSGDVFGAGKGIIPAYAADDASTTDVDERSKRMASYDSELYPEGGSWEYSDDTHQYVWEYFTKDTYNTFVQTLALATQTSVTVGGSAQVNGSVYGGSESGYVQHHTQVTVQETCNIGTNSVTGNVFGGGRGISGNATAGRASGNTTVNILGGTTYGDVYGGGEKGPVGTSSTTTTDSETSATTTTYPTATVNLLGGTITGDAYGGGLGDASTAADAGNTQVNLNGMATNEYTAAFADYLVALNTSPSDDDTKNDYYMVKTNRAGCKVTRIFGANNTNGTPKGDVTVHVYATQSKAEGKTTIGAKSQINTDTYDLSAVYGGGNEAAYDPTTPYTAENKSGSSSKVIIEGCAYTSIETVYGGGNAAAVPETNVRIVSDHEIGTVFGGGNGKDNKSDGSANPGADIGTKDQGVSSYGTGYANTLITGGYVHEAYGGSNEKGTIMGSVNLDASAAGICEMKVNKMVGAGKNADIMGDAIVTLGCMPETWVDEYYGGADNANVHGNVELTITSGNFRKVFGGNNQGGIIMGHVKVNIEETGCRPINIDELYLGGNQAAYSAYGYYVVKGENDAPVLNDGKLTFMPRESSTDTHLAVKKGFVGTTFQEWSGEEGDVLAAYDHPELNIISCTRIGKVFGGGLGATAKMYADPTVNINQIYGTPNDVVSSTLGAIGGSYTDANNETQPGGIFGGGNAANVYGNTTVNIGNLTEVAPVTTPTGLTKNDNDKYDVVGANIVGNVYGGGNEADVTGNTFVHVCANKSDETDSEYQAVSDGSVGVHITGSVFGGGKGKADTYTCEKAMVGIDGDGIDHPDGGTTVIIGNGTIDGSVYGGGEIGRVEKNTVVTIGIGEGVDTEGTATSAPVVKGNVFGAGKGLETHGYAALVRGNPTVTIQGNAKVLKSVYGGGEIASVARYQVVGGVPVALAQVKEGQHSGYCTVNVRGYAEIGPETEMKMYHEDVAEANDVPDDAGHVFAAGRGVLPENYTYADKDHRPKRMLRYDSETIDKIKYWEYAKTYPADYSGPKDIWQYFKDEDEYFDFIQTLALATQTSATISGNALVKGSVYGGSENGLVQYDTNVTIEGNCQIGCGKNTTGRHPAPVWGVNYTVPDDGTDLECASWEYDGQTGAPYDPYAIYEKDGKYYYDEACTNYANGGAKIAKDGHTYYGNVFGGGSGSVPYFDTNLHESRYIMTAGWVKGNTHVTINGGHILTNVYGGCEATNVDGTAYVTMTGGTLGVPRTLAQIDAHPVTCYLFGAGKGDQRVFYNKSTNVKDVEVSITGGRIYGSVFGGGEDGHVLRNVTMTIGQQSTTGEGTEAVTTTSGPTIGTWGTSYVDGNVFGGGRGFGGDAYTAGNVAGSVKMEIKGGTMLGSIYGGGRLGSVGYGLFDAETNGQPTLGYGEMRADTDTEDGFTDDTSNFFTKGRGHIDITISGGTIGNDCEYIIPNSVNIPTGLPATISTWTAENWKTWKAHNHIPKTEFDASGRLTHTKGGNVFAGGMGRQTKLDGQTPISGIDWWKLGCVKQTKLTITGGTIKSNVYGGGELGAVIPTNGNTEEGGKTEINISGSAIIGTVVSAVTTGSGESAQTNNEPLYTFGSVFGGGMGSESDTSAEEKIGGRVAGSTKITMSAGAVKGSVYGGGELAIVQGSHTTSDSKTVGAEINISGGTIGYNQDGFGGATMGNVYGAGKGSLETQQAGLIKSNTLINISGGTIYHNIYGGGAYGSVGTFTYETPSGSTLPASTPSGCTEGTGTAWINITGGNIGINGHENGMVFGSSRGDVAAPDATGEDPNNKLAWTKDTNVTIGGTAGSESSPWVRGSVYGSGENGHVLTDTHVTIHSGKIGIETSDGETYNITSGNTTYKGAAYPSRGNVYGGGCGTDTYLKNGVETFNPLAGVVYGTTTINMDGGQVARNIYGAGAMGSVGKATTANDFTTVSGGTTTINVSGGTVGVDGTNGDGNVFGAARGDASATINQFALVRKSTNVSVTGGTIKGNVYGGGELGSVGTFTVSNDMRTFTWTDTDGTDNAANNEKNTGVCHVTVNGSSADINGKVFGGGKGLDDTFWCEKGIAYSTKVNIVKGTVTGNVYGGGEVGRVETDSYVKIGDDDGTAEGTSTPSIMGSVFGGGAGVETHGYSALVRGNTTVTVEGNASVAHSVYGGGEIASVGKYGLDAQKMPSILQGGGYCYVTVRGHANIAEDVFGAGQGVTPHFNNDNDDHSKRSRRMTVYNSTDFPNSSGPNGSGTWEYYEDYPDDYSGTKFVWDYYQTSESYSTYLETLALATHPEVTIDGDATVNGSVFGGGELGLTKGSVIVKIKGGTIAEDVYGGGSLANTNTTSTVDLDGDGETETVYPTTTVRLTGGTINRNVYGGGLGQLAKDAVEAQPAVEAVEAKVYGDVLVELNKPTSTTTGEGESATTTTTYGDCEVQGIIFGCNNLNGSPQKDVTVHVYKTVTKDNDGTENYKPDKNENTYELTAVYGGGNLAAFYPDDETWRAKAKTNVIIDGCELTSIETVYGGGNAASVPATDVVINSAYEVGQAFGGGNGADEYVIDGKTYENPGANVGYMSYAYHTWDGTANKYIAHEYTDADGTDKDASTKDKRVTNYGTDDNDSNYGTGKAHVTVKGGTVHEVYAGSNTRGNIRVESRATLVDADDNTCEFNVAEAYGGGRNALQDGNAILDIGCISGLGKAYGGASNADVNGNVILNITNGTYGQVFGGNDMGGCIRGSITVNVEETGCRPVIIGELYGGGNKAAYSVYGYNDNGTLKTSGTAVTSPTVNVRSFTSIGRIFGGGYGEEATMVGDPEVNVDVLNGKYAATEEVKEGARVIGSSVKEPDDDGYDATKGFPIPSHAIDAIGAIQDVFGGGNEAEVVGTTHVNIGTEEYVPIVSVATGSDVSGYYTRTGEGTSENPYVYNDATGTAVEETTYYKKVEGVDIRGNVYGGGNNAEVTGDTKVVIGKKVE